MDSSTPTPRPSKTRVTIKLNLAPKDPKPDSEPVTEAEAQFESEIDLEDDIEPESPTPSRRQPHREAKLHVLWRDLNAGEVSAVYPWYPGSQLVQHERDSPDAMDESRGSPEMEDNATIAEDPLAGIKLRKLPVGLTSRDIQDPEERYKFETKMQLASSTATMVMNLDNEQIMRFLVEIKACPFTTYLDANRVLRSITETMVTFGVEDMIREGYIKGATDYPINQHNPTQAVDAYAVMENIYRSASNTRGEINSYASLDPENENKMRWHRSLYHDVRAKNIIAGIEKVEQKWKSITPRRYRTISTLRLAFDYLSNIYHPTYPWPCSHAYFEATLEMIRINEIYCMLVFEEDKYSFLEGLRKAMVDAETRRMKEWIEARSDEQFFDLMGTGLAPDFEDSLEGALNPYNSAS
ncbi:uncharacterized protein LY89DRAFT_739952 [Mollisia scopiformis]|uniref:Uncharacterized protein n=1 Tax=Mollisia scopiformis TaxID=149040 RepID=A0A194WSR4_MOLSC|nr:uncharacterized protein LY89DRAFT_739952 [Mollisia scopiformis]KUJ10986.1 hypothetical protein LY89DRAFT_739952 [Mollisia scopiformis]